MKAKQRFKKKLTDAQIKDLTEKARMKECT